MVKYFIFIGNFISLLVLRQQAAAQEDRCFWYEGVLVSEQDDSTVIRAPKILAIQFKDKGFASNCTYLEVLSRLIKTAKAKGGNLLKITMHKAPDGWSSCHRVFVDVYKTDSPQVYEKEIAWSAGRRLQISDFKGKPGVTGDVANAAVTYSWIRLVTNRVTLFKGPNFFVANDFDCYNSWFGEKHKSDPDILQHEQTHFDLSEVYARRLRKALAERHLNVVNLDEANAVYKQVTADLKLRQEQYDKDCGHGIQKEPQERWNKQVASELNELADYAEN